MKNRNRTKHILKIVAILCTIILLIEGAYLGILYQRREKSTIYIDTSSSFLETEKAIYLVGSSDFKSSRDIAYTKGVQKAKFAKYDKNGKILFEKAYTKGYGSIFNALCKVDDGYIVVGHYAKTKQDQQENTGPGLIVKYDEEGKVLFEKEISILADTDFVKVKALEDGGFLVLGQSIFENMTLGMDERGGAQMIRFDKNGEEVWRANYGGSKSAIFQDAYIDEEEDLIYVVGKDAIRTGIFMKYTLDGEQIFVKNYSGTDNVGFSSIAKIGTDFVVVGGKKSKEEKEDYQTEALLVKYDREGNLLFEKTYQKNEMARFNAVTVKDEKIYVVGHSASLNLEKTTDVKRAFDYAGIYASFDKDGAVLSSKEYQEKNTETYFSTLRVGQNEIQIVGQSSAKYFQSNKKDIKAIYFTIDAKGKIKQQYF